MICNISFSVFILVLSISSCWSQPPSKSDGPIIHDYGEVYSISDLDYPVNGSQQYKVIFDIYSSPKDPGQLNAQINTVARFMNMHAQAGVSAENIYVAVVIHGSASEDARNNFSYQKKFGVANPNSELLRALHNAGAEMFICGQSLYSRKMVAGDLAPGIGVGLSAMTILLSYQDKGYGLIKF